MTIDESCGKRLRMRDWLEPKISDPKYPGLKWINKEEKIFRIPWKHGGRHGWREDHDGLLFREWSQHTGASPKDTKQHKANFRCALNSLRDIRKLPRMNKQKGDDAYRVYQLVPLKSARKDRTVWIKRRKHGSTCSHSTIYNHINADCKPNKNATVSGRIINNNQSEPATSTYHWPNHMRNANKSSIKESNLNPTACQLSTSHWQGCAIPDTIELADNNVSAFTHQPSEVTPLYSYLHPGYSCMPTEQKLFAENSASGYGYEQHNTSFQYHEKTTSRIHGEEQAGFDYLFEESNEVYPIQTHFSPDEVPVTSGVLTHPSDFICTRTNDDAIGIEKNSNMSDSMMDAHNGVFTALPNVFGCSSFIPEKNDFQNSHSHIHPFDGSFLVDEPPYASLPSASTLLEPIKTTNMDHTNNFMIQTY